MVAERAAFFEEQPALSEHKLVFLDESAISTNLHHPGDVVIMDNLRVHKNPDAVAAIQATGATVVFQPRYSPEFNAIEHCWSWLKHHLRSLGCRAIDPLVSYAEQLWRKITPELCQSWAKGCGYAV